MPPRLQHAVGLQLEGDPPSFEDYTTKPENKWIVDQDGWLDKF